MSDISSHKTGSWRYRDTAGATQRYNEAGINQCPGTFVTSFFLCFSLSAVKTFSHFPPFLLSVDGVFGRCQELAGADLYTYDISSSALQRLRILLQKLAHRGTEFPFACLSFSECAIFSVQQPVSVMFSHGKNYSNCLSTAIV